jgi:hypothetical protein
MHRLAAAWIHTVADLMQPAEQQQATTVPSAPTASSRPMPSGVRCHPSARMAVTTAGCAYTSATDGTPGPPAPAASCGCRCCSCQSRAQSPASMRASTSGSVGRCGCPSPLLVLLLVRGPASPVLAAVLASSMADWGSKAWAASKDRGSFAGGDARGPALVQPPGSVGLRVAGCTRHSAHCSGQVTWDVRKRGVRGSVCAGQVAASAS